MKLFSYSGSITNRHSATGKPKCFIKKFVWSSFNRNAPFRPVLKFRIILKYASISVNLPCIITERIN